MVMSCTSCGSSRDINTLPMDQLYTKYRIIYNDAETELFKDLLKYLPMIDNRKSIQEYIDTEYFNESNNEKPLYAKL
jgi:hypothetical protein